MKCYFLSLNNLINIPSIRFVVDSMTEELDTSVTIVESYIPGQNNYYENKEQVNFKYLARYANDFEFRNQSGYNKILKYLKLNKLIFNLLTSKKDTIIITPDIQVLFFLFLLKKLIPKTNLVTCYMQFELVEDFRFGRFNKYIYNNVLKNANKIDIATFPEINRSKIFYDSCKTKYSTSFILPNSCLAISENDNIIKHKTLRIFPNDAFIIGHVGVLGGEDHYFEELINAAKVLKRDNLFFVFYGRLSEEISKKKTELEKLNIYLFDRVPHQELEQLYPFFNLGLILYKGISPNIEYCAPNKLYEFWAYGIPVIADTLKGLQPVFKNNFQGKLIDLSNENEIVNCINLYYDIRDKNDNNVKLVKYFNAELQISNYLPKLISAINRSLNEKTY